jgi:type II secretory pathway pseudopilin PulG
MRARHQQGNTLVGLLLALALAGLVATLSIYGLRPAASRRGAESCAFALAQEIRAASVLAVASGRDRALLFPDSSADEPLRWIEDLDGDGATRSDALAAIDRSDPPFTLASRVEGCRVGKAAFEPLRELPPSTALLDPATPAVRFGRGRSVVLTHHGTATPGSVMVGDTAHAVCAIVVHGAMARTRVFCWDQASESWNRR